MIVAFFVIVPIFVFLIIFSIPIKVTGSMHINLLGRDLCYAMRLPFMVLSSGKLDVDEKFNLNKNTHTSFMMDSDETNEEKTLFVYHLLNRLKVANADLVVEGGKKDDAFFSAMMIGVIYAFSVSLLSVIDKKNNQVNPTIIMNPSFEEDKFLATGRFQIYISVIDVIIAKLQSI